MLKSIINNILINIFTTNKINIFTKSKKSKLKGKNKINRFCNVNYANIDYATYISKNCNLEYAKIGKYCSIANNVKVIRGTHPTSKFVSTHPAFFSTKKQSGFTYIKKNKFEEYKFVDNKYSIVIKNDVWIGANVTILEGVTINDGAIIGANSIVTKDIEPYSINVGNPAKPIKYRFKKNQIDFLEKDKWWNKNEKWIKENVDLFDDIAKYKKECKNEK